MPLFNKIADRHKTSSAPVSTGDIAVVHVDHVYLQDGNIPTIAKLFRQNNFTRVFDPARISCFIDHAVLSPTIEMTNMLHTAESFANEFGLNFYKGGEGISHVIALENGIFQPHGIVLGADSHTCTGGAVQCLALGMGATDITYAMLTGTTWLKVPETKWIKTKGFPAKPASSKDVMLYALHKYGQTPFLYRSIEWDGEYVKSLTLDAMATMANMSVEQGAKCAFFPKAINYHNNGMEAIEVQPTDDNSVFEIDISGLPPFIAKPHLPFNAFPYHECSGIKISYVFIGTCTNGRLEDLEEVASVLKGRKIARSVKCIITPGSKKVYMEALSRGLITTFMEAGALVTPPGCGSCVGTQGIIPGDNDTVFSTMNRNFIGRMGNPNAPIYLGSPLMAAVTAVLGNIPDQKDILS